MNITLSDAITITAMRRQLPVDKLSDLEVKLMHEAITGAASKRLQIISAQTTYAELKRIGIL